MSSKKALYRLIFWIDLALLIDAGIFFFMGKEKALEFISGYIIEQSLSIDNLFLFIMIFSSFGIKSIYQRRILNYGIAGALILRFVFITLGVAIVNRFHWVLYVFGIVLIISGVNMLFKKDEMTDVKESRIFKFLGKIVPVTKKLEGDKFFVKKDGTHYITPLFAVLILIEFTDIIFAIDSIPAIFSITTDPFIVYTSNILAIIGLRNMYFVLGKMHEKFKYVRYGVGMILTFTGIKLSFMIFDLHIPTQWSLIMIFILLTGSILLSVYVTFSDGTDKKYKNG